MSLRDLLNKPREGGTRKIYARYGVLKNPFPAAGQPSGNPHMRTEADDVIVDRLRVFERDNTSQVLVVEGTQGVGKTNFLNYYEKELEDLYSGEDGSYVIRYYPDPEPSFDGVLRRIFQELGANHLARVAEVLNEKDDDEQERILQGVVRNQEVRNMLTALSRSDDIASTADIAMEWLLGVRVLNRHRDALGIQFRLDTVESRTQALRDLVEASIELGTLRGIFLLLDELEKQDLTLSKTTVLRYLLAIRALVDALARNFFFLVAVTPEAKRRYFQMVPAFQGRLQNAVVLRPIATPNEGLRLFRFYVDEARKGAKRELEDESGVPPAGTQSFMSDAEVIKLFNTVLQQSAARGVEGVTHRDFLNALHIAVEPQLAQAMTG